MGIIKYLSAIWVGILIYTLFSMNTGAIGLSAYRQLENEREKEIENIESLVQINKNLKDAEEAVFSDRDTLISHAREQGFSPPNEHFARIVGMGVPLRNVISPGQVVAAASPEHTSELFIKIFSFCTALVIIFCMIAFDFLQYLKDR